MALAGTAHSDLAETMAPAADQRPVRRRAPEPVGIADPRHLLLTRLLDEKARFELRFTGSAEAFHTIMLELVPERGYIVIDGLHPHAGNALLDRARDVTLSTRVTEGEISFQTRVVRRGGAPDKPFYQALYPESIASPFRREEHRVHVPLDKHMRARVRLADGAELNGAVRDLSPSGFSLELTATAGEDATPPAGSGGTCEISMDNGEQLKALVDVCHARRLPQEGTWRVGMCFTDCDAQTARAIERHVARLDRERARVR